MGQSHENAKLERTIEDLKNVLQNVGVREAPVSKVPNPVTALLSDVQLRMESIGGSIALTAERSADEMLDSVRLFRDWMVDSAIVRVIGAGRAKLAASLPANRLAHGGARVYIQDDLIPMPHSIKGGGVIAASASGETASVLDVLRAVRRKQARVLVVGIARHSADEFRSLCDRFIGIRQVEGDNPLQALADTEEYVISMLLDAMVVAAGKLAGFDDIKWRLGHEDLGPTGPYGAETRWPTVLTTTEDRLAPG